MRKDNNMIIQLQRYYALWKECTAMYEEWSKDTEYIARISIYINAVALWIVFCKYCSHRIPSPYHLINQ